MSASFRIAGRSGKQVAAVGRHDHSPVGVMVYAHDAVHKTYYPAKLADVDGNTDLSVAFSSVTAGEGVHNGGDTALWTASQIAGTTVDFASTVNPHTGTASIDMTNMRNNDTVSFLAGATINPTAYSYLELYVDIRSWNTQGTSKDFTIECLNNGAPAGVSVNLSNYVDTAIQGSWQLVLIPMADFGITAATIDDLRITCVDIGRGSPPTLYMDNIQFLGTTTTGVRTFTFAPEPGEHVGIRGIKWTGVNSGKKDIIWNEFWGLTQLTNGCTLTVRAGGGTAFTLVVKDIYDFASIAPVELRNTGDGSTGAIITALATLHDEGMILDGDSQDSISVTVRDDITALDAMTVALEAYILDYSLEE